MAVRIDIRPRLTLRDEPPARARRSFRLPPLTLPSVAYWLAMAALTYVFAHLENPLESAAAAEPAALPAPSPPPAFEPPAETVAAALTPPPLPSPTTEAVASAEPAPEPERSERELPQPADLRPETRSEHRADAGTQRETAAIAPALPAPRLEFPEFTDSSPARRPERAADGPRLDALFERREERDRSEAPAPPAESERDAPIELTSCERAIARNNEQLTIGGPRGPADVTRDQYAAILQNGRYLAGCSIPDRTVFEICAAVQNGRAVGITVTSSPTSPALSQCVRRAVSRLKFPSNPRLDVTHTRFDAQGR